MGVTQSVGCPHFTTIKSCLFARDYHLATSGPTSGLFAVSRCAWVFKTAISGIALSDDDLSADDAVATTSIASTVVRGRCFFIDHCSNLINPLLQPGHHEAFDPYDPMQNTPLPNITGLEGFHQEISRVQLNSFAKVHWILPKLHSCMYLSLGTQAVCVLLVCLAIGLGIFLGIDSIRHPEKAHKFPFAFSCLCVNAILLICYAINISLNGGEDKQILLPFFALFVLNLEVLHIFPSPGVIFLRRRKFISVMRDPVSELRHFRNIRVHRNLTIPFTLFLRVGYTLLWLAALLTLVAPSLAFLSEALAPYEILGLTSIAWFDAIQTVLVSFGYLLRFFAISSKDKGNPSKHKVSTSPQLFYFTFLVTLFWGFGLIGFAAFLTVSCRESDYNTPVTSYFTFTECEDKFASRAYALAFFSMLRGIIAVMGERALHRFSHSSHKPGENDEKHFDRHQLPEELSSPQDHPSL
jgi:hypothetical protein